MEYKIVAATPEIGQIEVAYFMSGEHVGTYAIDVPIVDGLYITGEVLSNEIQHRAPVWLVERKQSVHAAPNFAEIEALIVPITPTAVVLSPPLPLSAEALMWRQTETEQLVAKALVKFGVLSSDPTAIEVAML